MKANSCLTSLAKIFLSCCLLFISLLSFGCGCDVNLSVDYEFDPGDSVINLNNNYTDKDLIVFRGFMYYLSAPKFLLKTWPPPLEADTWLFPPSDIYDTPEGGGGGPYNQTIAKGACYRRVDDDISVTYNWFCGGTATTLAPPVKPPTGTHKVIAGIDTWNVQIAETREINQYDTVDGIYIPLPMLTVVSNMVTELNWTWWKKSSGTWANPDDADLAANIKNTHYEIRLPGDTAVTGSFDLTTTGSITLPSGINFNDIQWVRMSETDVKNWHYGFAWD